MWRMILAALVCAACGGGSGPVASDPGAGTEAGTCTLISVAGTPIPATLTEAGHQATVLSSTLTLAGGAVHLATQFRVLPDTTTTTQTLSGSYQRRGNTLTFHYGNGGSNSGTLDGADLHFINEGVTWLYRRTSTR